MSERSYATPTGHCCLLVLLVSAAGSLYAAPCKTGQLKIEKAQGDSAMSHVELNFNLRNTSPARCTLQGFPVVRFLDGKGARLPLRSVPDKNSEPAAGLLDVKPGEAATFFVRYGTSGPYDGVKRCPPRAKRMTVAIGKNKRGLGTPIDADACTDLTVSSFRAADAKAP